MRISDWSSDVCSSDLLPFGLIPYFVDDIGCACISLRHCCKEAFGLLHIPVGVMIVPVDDDINAAFHPSVGNLSHQCRLLFGLLQVPFIGFDSHGKPDEGHIEVIDQQVDNLVVLVLSSSPYAPGEAHAS